MSVQAGTVSACLHPEAVGQRWGDAVSEERQAALKVLAERQREWAAQPEATRGESVCKGAHLTGAEVSWLAEESRRDFSVGVPNLHLEGANLRVAHLEGVNLREAHLEGAGLSQAHLEGATLLGAHLEGAFLLGSHLEGANLGEAYLEGANLARAHLKGADLTIAHLERAYLSEAHLEGATLWEAHLEGAALVGAWLNSQTVLTGATITDTTRLGDVQWSGVGAVNLTQLDWTRVHRLGDETSLKRNGDAAQYEAAVRAYRQVAAQLRVEGMSEIADHFLHRALIVQRHVLRKRHHFGRWLGSWFLAAFAGYGYAPMRPMVWYLVCVASFAGAYYALGPTEGRTFAPHDALVFSVTSFHGRGFFPESRSFESRVTRLAALEAVVGLLIKVSFIATFTQRFFRAR